MANARIYGKPGRSQGKAAQWQASACPTGKRAYLTKSAAKASAKLLGRNGSGDLMPYVCFECHNQWHIGHRKIWVD